MISRLLHNYIEQQAPYQSTGGLFMSAYSIIFSAPLAEGQSPIADHSLLILLLVSIQPVDTISHTWHESILIQSIKESSSPVLNFELESKISFKLIYDQIAKSMDKDESVIFLYLMLIRNNPFKIYFLSRSDPEEMVLIVINSSF
jgi:Dyggve-Melchior-Clausen syndrome protein